MNPGDSKEVERVIDLLTKCTLAAKWEVVIDLYAKFPDCQKTKINESLGTALHVAVDMKKQEVVTRLVNEILRWLYYTGKTNPLQIQNKSGDTPLHVAASRGFTAICKILIGDRRTYLLSQRNKRGETPLFQAVINGHKHSFLYLSNISGISQNNFDDLLRDNKDTILHSAITSEFFALALIIVHSYPFLCTKHDNEGFTPLKVLATRPSAFKGATMLPLWKRILYHCILVEQPVDVESHMQKILDEIDKPPKSDKLKYPKNYATLCAFSARISKMSWKKNQRVDTENPPIEQFGFGLLPPNYKTFQQFVKSAFVHILGLSGVDINELKNTKERHQWGYQLFKKLMRETPVKEYIGGGDLPPDYNIDLEMFNVFAGRQQTQNQAYTGEGGAPPNDPNMSNDYTQQGETSHSADFEEEGKPNAGGKTETLSRNVDDKNIVIIRREITRSEVLEEERKPKVDGRIKALTQSDTNKETDQHADDEKNIVIIRRETKSLELLEEERKPKADGKTETLSDIVDDTPLLVAARNGIVEMVDGILTESQGVIYETNSQEENVLLVAVRNKKPHVVEKLRKKFQEPYPEVWNTLTLALNKDGKSMLHMAAYAPEDYKPWQISGCALQLIWDVNWFQYIKSLAPEQYRLRSDKHNQTASEIFKEEHKELRKESGEWLRETSESCSVVAALVAGVSFATAATVPGGNDDKGMPHLEDRPAFHAFVVSSLVGLCSSLTGLIMFLTILTSRKLYREFRRNLPLKLVLGLSSLFISIVALLVSFCTSHSFLFKHKYKTVIFPIYIATCFPVTFYAIAQLPLYFDLLTTFLFKVPKAASEGDSL